MKLIEKCKFALLDLCTSQRNCMGFATSCEKYTTYTTLKDYRDSVKRLKWKKNLPQQQLFDFYK